MLAVWNKAYETNIEIIDIQHKELVRLFGELERMAINYEQYKHEDFMHVMCEIRNYVTYHFYTEERYMAAIDFPEVFIHTEMHEIFKRKISKISYERLQQNPQNEIRKLRQLIEDFIMKHMLIEDQEIGHYAKKRNIWQPPNMDE